MEENHEDELKKAYYAVCDIINEQQEWTETLNAITSEFVPTNPFVVERIKDCEKRFNLAYKIYLEKKKELENEQTRS